MAEQNFFSHTNKKDKKRREPDDRALEAGIKNPHLAENIIEGFVLKYSSGMKVVTGAPGEFIKPGTEEVLEPRTYLELTNDLLKQWMNSKGHRDNILSEKAIELGCGTWLFYMKDFNEMPVVRVTQNFQWFEPVIF